MRGFFINERTGAAAELIQLLMRSSDPDVLRGLADELPRERSIGGFRNVVERSPLSLLECLMQLAVLVDNKPLYLDIERRVGELLARTERLPLKLAIAEPDQDEDRDAGD